jgi:plastocyanin
MNKKAIIAMLVVVVVLLSAVIWALTRPAVEPDTNTGNSPVDSTATDESATDAPTTSESAGPDASSEQAAVTITYTGSGFDKSSYTVKSGETVKIQNNSDSTLSLNSDDHPTHTKQSELNVGEVAPGQSKTFTIDTAGTWGFHDHFNSAHTSSITVQ